MQDLRLILIVIGAIAIVMLLLHGIWTSGQQPSSPSQQCPIKTFNKKRKQPLSKDLDKGPKEAYTRVSFIKNKKFLANFYTIRKKTILTPKPTQSVDYKVLAQSNLARDSDKQQYNNNEQQATLYRQSFLHNRATEEELKSAIVLHNTSIQQHKPEAEIQPTCAKLSQEQSKETVLVLHVAAHHGGMICGEVLLQSLLRVGLQFGEMNIFHRHISLDGTGSIVFSLANMVKPGSFNLNRMSNFVTPGVSLFMVAPFYGDANKNFKLMLQSAQRIADNIGGIVLDDTRHMMTLQAVETYKARLCSALEKTIDL